MIYLKKLFFAPLYFISLFLTIYLFLPFIKSTDLIFSLDSNVLYKLIVLTSAILMTALFFVCFSVIAQTLEFNLAVIFISALIPFLILPVPQALIFAIILVVFLIINYLNTKKTLADYLDFKPTKLFSQQVKQLAGFLVILLSINFYIAVNNQIKSKGFQIPDSLIDTVLKFTPQNNLTVKGFKYSKSLAQLPTITPEQLELLKKNPQLLKQYGVDPSLLDNLKPAVSNSKENINPTNALLKPLIKAQIQKMIDPYLNYLPLILTLLFLLTLNSLVSLAFLILPVLIYIIFYILEATKFISFTTETRQVKKMVV